MANENETKIPPAIAKLLAYAKGKQVITFDEINEVLGPDFTNPENEETESKNGNMDDVLRILAENKIQVIEEGIDDLSSQEAEM
ncbi:RNA polymerase sigma factor region1.1 domain-containing protein, partial [Treponema saccharophilum]